MAVTTTKTNKPLNPRGNDQSPKGYNRAELYTGKALDFDGTNDNISIPLFNFTAGNKYSLCIYANRDNNGMIWSHSNQFVEIRFYGGALQVRTYDSSWNIYTLIDDVPANEWHQIVVTYDVDGNIWKGYLNGQFVKSVTAAAPLYPRINRIASGGGTFYDGEFANAKIFEVELTAAQVADLYNNPEKIVPTGVSNDALKLWLPMQEGAGTTAYDGSGNGNHGTISGATYTHGIGAPVSQTAVIDWNKGTNRLTDSEDFDQWTKANVVLTANAATAPDGNTTAYSMTDNTTNSEHKIEQVVSSTTATHSFFVKANGAQYVQLVGVGVAWYQNFDIVNGTFGNGDVTNKYIEDYGNGWYRISGYDGNANTKVQLNIITSSTSARAQNYAGDGTRSIYVWGAALVAESTAGPYVRTLSTAQTSDVLLPAGLTTGRDITGVNLFENVRKQGALNLDGNSWAEVHDNASLDITDAITLEAWVYWDGASDRGILSKYDYYNSQRSYLLYQESSTAARFYASSNGAAQTSVKANTTFADGNWYHLVGVYDGAELIIYVNGAEDNTLAYTSDIFSSNNVLEIGRYGQSRNAAHEYTNQIAQPRIYNRALSAEEIERNYNAGKNIYK